MHIEIFHDYLCRLAIGTDGKRDAAFADRVLTCCFVSKDVAIVMFHGERHFFRTLHNCESVVLLDDRNVAKEIVRVLSKVSVIF